MKMKKLFLTLGCLGVIIGLTGCTSTTLPSADVLYTTSYSVGKAAAFVLKKTSLDDKDKSIIIDIAKTVSTSLPKTNSTFEATWTPIAADKLAKLVENQTIIDTESQLILSIFTNVVKTLDYIIEKRYPTVGQNIELLEAVTHGFTTGFLDSITVNTDIVSQTTDIYDREAYDYLIKSLK